MAKRHADNGGDPGIEELLHRLNGNDAGVAWASFIDHYASLILRAVRQFEFEQDRIDDCFLFVCEKLCERGFRRLLKFDTTGPARFRTWLGSVVHNLCVDWHRKEYGRAVMLPAISALPLFDQAVYRLYFEQGVEREVCRRTLREEFPGLTQEQLGDSIARVQRLLTPRQRWRIAISNRGRPPVIASGKSVRELADPGAGPELLASQAELQDTVREAFARLSPDQRLLLQLRYEQGLTLKKIAELTNLGDPFRARRKIQAALDALAIAMPRSELKKI